MKLKTETFFKTENNIEGRESLHMEGWRTFETSNIIQS